MNEGLIPNRYAKALYKTAIEQGVAEKVYEQMKQLSRSFVSVANLQDTVDNPYLPTADKEKILLTASSAEKDSLVDKFILMVINSNRISFVRSMALAYEKIFRKANSIELVTVVTAANLENSELEKIKKIVQDHEIGKKLEFLYEVNPDLVGGFVIRMDSLQLDASIKNELKKLRLKLLS